MLRALRVTDGADDSRSEIDERVRRCAAVRSAVTEVFGDAGLPSSGMATPWAADLADATFKKLEVSETLAGLAVEAATAFVAAPGNGGMDPLKVLRAALCVEVVNGIGGVPVDPSPHPLFDFVRMGITDVPGLVLPPATESALTSAPSAILYGTRLNHFGGFGRPEWREWDWTLGRVHGAVHLCRLLSLSGQDTAEIIEAVLRAEGTDPQRLAAGIESVVSKTTDELLADLRHDGTTAATLDSVFELLDTSRSTSPELRPALRSLGSWVAALAARQKPLTMTRPQRGIRLLTGWLRRRLWRKISSG
jgi:hypothetical protein